MAALRRRRLRAGGGVHAQELRGERAPLHRARSSRQQSTRSLTQRPPVETLLSYGAFGERRNANGWIGNPTAGAWTEITDGTRRGFTFHEMLDNLNLTHMNGRVYDQISGRFLSADPFVPDPGFTQSFNRYSYVYNN